MKATKRQLIGRRIAAIDWNRTWDQQRGQFIARPLITLDNGRVLWFVTQESDNGDYGTTICISRAQGGTASDAQ